MAEQLQAILEYIHADVAERATRRTRDELRTTRETLVRATRVCDGSAPAAVREWIQDVEIAAKYFPAGTRDADVRHVVAATLQGPMRRCYERFLAAQPDRDNVSWEAIREHLRRAYLTQDEEEFLKTQLERLTQSAYESNAAFSRRYEELAEQAYPPALRNDTVEKLILTGYLRGLRSAELVKRLVQEANPTDLTGAMAAVEQYSAQEEYLQRVVANRPEAGRGDEMEVGEVKSSKTETMAEKSAMQHVCAKMDELSRKVAGLQREFTRLSARTRAAGAAEASAAPAPVMGRGRGMRAGPAAAAPARRPGEPIKCYECNRPGHIGRDCEVRKARLAAEVAAIEDAEEEEDWGNAQ
jgi:hypothetical protein